MRGKLAPFDFRAAAAQIGESAFQTVPDRRQTSRQRNHSAHRHRARADIQNIRAANLSGRHFARSCSSIPARAARSDTVAEKFDHRNQNEIRQNAAAHHNSGDIRSDDVADTEQRGIIFERNRAAFQCIVGKFFSGLAFPKTENLHQRVVQKSDDETDGDNFSALQSAESSSLITSVGMFAGDGARFSRRARL